MTDPVRGPSSSTLDYSCERSRNIESVNIHSAFFSGIWTLSEGYSALSNYSEEVLSSLSSAYTLMSMKDAIRQSGVPWSSLTIFADKWA